MRVLCLPYTHTLSHISRPLLVAKELRNRGHEVVFAGDSSKDNFVKDEGFEVLPLYQIPPALLFGRIRDGKLRFVLDDELNRMIEADLGLFSAVKPDLVLSDGRFSAPISTGIKGCNHAAIVNVSSTEYRALPYIPLFDRIPEWLNKKDSALEKCLNRINLSVEMRVFNYASHIFEKLSKQHRLGKTVNATNCLAGKDLTLLADIDEYFPTRNLPENYAYIGPLTWKSDLRKPEWWPPQRKNNTLVYITMGTTWMGGSFENLFELCKKHRITAIITTGGQGGEHGMQSMEGEVYVEDFLDGDLVMQESDLVVCHGGNGTIYQALQNGKPIIGIPTIPDQQFNMRRVEALGVGKTLQLKELSETPETLFEMIKEIRESPEFMKNARRFQQKLSGLQPAIKAADLIEKFFLKPT